MGVMDIIGLTPVEKRGEIWVKRDDLFKIAGVCGGKARACWGLAAKSNGLVSAGSRVSPQLEIVGNIAKYLGIPCRLHTSIGNLSMELLRLKSVGVEFIQHKPGYNNVIIARARNDFMIMKKEGWKYVPFGMECYEAVVETRKQVQNIPFNIKRLLVSVGSGMTLAGILWGLKDKRMENILVLGIIIGANPEKRLDKYAPFNWRGRVKLIKSELNYYKLAEKRYINGLEVDAVYEAKCLPYLEKGDLFWIVGKHK